MDLLPDELLIQVFSHLPARDLLLRVRAVCRRWRNIVPERDVWLRTSLSVLQPGDLPLARAVLGVAPCLGRLLLNAGSIPAKDVEEVLAAARPLVITGLELRQTSSWQWASERVLSDDGCHLSISLPGKDLSAALPDIFNTISKLKLVELNLDAWRTWTFSPDPTAAGTPPPDIAMKNLKRLCLPQSCCPDAFAASLVRACANSLRDVKVSVASAPLTRAALAECARLSKAELYVEEETLGTLTDRGSVIGKVERLTLTGASNVTMFVCLRDLLVSGVSNLQHLSLVNTAPDIVEVPPYLPSGLPGLRRLHLSNVAPEEFLQMACNPFRALQVLDLGGFACRELSRECLLVSIMQAVKIWQNIMHIVGFKFFLCESSSAHKVMKCCHQHDENVRKIDSKMTSPLFGLFPHYPMTNCLICIEHKGNVDAWLSARQQEFDLEGMLKMSTVFRNAYSGGRYDDDGDDDCYYDSYSADGYGDSGNDSC